jgi:hypothetical protein
MQLTRCCLLLLRAGYLRLSTDICDIKVNPAM